MKSRDVGIDLGTTSVIVYVAGKGIVMTEPSVVAVNTETDDVIAVGKQAYDMIGKTPSKIQAIQPMKDGVISDYDVTEAMLKYYIKRVGESLFFKPRVAVCIPAMTTEVEQRATKSAALAVGARKIYLIEEPIAAAIGAGIDISKPCGNMVVDIGGGTADIAVISLNGTVTADSVKMAGVKLDEAIVNFIRKKYSVLIGEKMAERIKIELCDLIHPDEKRTMEIKGRNLVQGLPCRLTVNSKDVYDAIVEEIRVIVDAIKAVIERTPPELVGDIKTNGVTMTGGGALLGGLAEYLSREIGTDVHVAEKPLECVGLGTGRIFEFIDKLGEDFLTSKSLIY